MASSLHRASLRPRCVLKTISHEQSSVSKRQFSHTPTLNATLIKRPKRPYTFTQLVTLSDGSSFLHRTTSPTPVLKSNKDMRNAPMWNPTSQKLLNVEEDEAGRLRAFRARFGRGWDSEITAEMEEGKEGESKEAEKHESLLDLISGFAQPEDTKAPANLQVVKPGKRNKK